MSEKRTPQKESALHIHKETQQNHKVISHEGLSSEKSCNLKASGGDLLASKGTHTTNLQTLVHIVQK